MNVHKKRKITRLQDLTSYRNRLGQDRIKIMTLEHHCDMLKFRNRIDKLIVGNVNSM